MQSMKAESRLKHARPINALSPACALLIAALCVSATLVQATIITHDAILEPDATHDYVVSLSKSIPEGMGLFAFAIDENIDDEFTFAYGSVAEYCALFSVSYNTELTPSYAQSLSPIAANYGEPPPTSTISIPVDSELYVGYWDNRNGGPGPGLFTMDASDNYGWFLLRNTASGLQISDGATAVGDGIVVGTYTQIPEPSAIAMLVTSAPLVFLRRRRIRG